MKLLLCSLLLAAAVLAENYYNPVGTKPEFLEVWTPLSSLDCMSFQTNSVNSTAVRAATCRDADLARYINFALQRYIHDMDQLTKSILNQVDLLQPNSYNLKCSDHRCPQDWKLARPCPDHLQCPPRAWLADYHQLSNLHRPGLLRLLLPRHPDLYPRPPCLLIIQFAVLYRNSFVYNKFSFLHSKELSTSQFSATDPLSCWTLRNLSQSLFNTAAVFSSRLLCCVPAMCSSLYLGVLSVKWWRFQHTPSCGKTTTIWSVGY